MNRAGQVALLVAALAVSLGYVSYAKRALATEAEDFESLSNRVQEETRVRELVRAQELRTGLVILGASAAILVAAGWAGAAPRFAASAAGLVGVAGLYLLYRWSDYYLDWDFRDVEAGEWALPVLALLFLAIVGQLWSSGAVDGFSLGAIVLALSIETIVYIAWLQSPQGEAGSAFYAASCLPAILVALTLLVHRVQRQA